MARRHGLLMVAAGLLLAGAEAVGQTVIYVDDDAAPAGNGQSWNTAYRFLQDALTEAATLTPPVEIRVAQGLYLPDRDELDPDGSCTPGPCDRTRSFELIDGVEILGGYAGIGAPDPDQRNLFIYQSTLSGDIDGNDLPGFVNVAANTHHVVYSTGVGSTALLDGFTVTAGNTPTGSPITNCGGGILLDGGDARINACRFVGNLASNCGAGSTVRLGNTSIFTNCLFACNQANFGSAFEPSFAAPALVNCTISDHSGTAIWNNGSTLTIENCIVYGNAAVGGGGNDPVWIINYSGIQGGAGVFDPGGVGNIDADPLFVDPTNGDYALSAMSPCIDAGSNPAVPDDVVTDLAGGARFLDDPETPDTGEPDGILPIVDMGAFEFPGIGGLNTFTGTGSWFNPGNWSLGAVPAATDTVIIDGSVMIDQPGAVAGLVTVNGTLHIVAGLEATFGALSMSSGGELSLEIGGPSAAGSYGRLVVVSHATLDGTLTVSLVNGYTPETESYELLTADQISGQFSSQNLPDPGGNLAPPLLTVGATGVTLQYVSVRLYVDAMAPPGGTGGSWLTAFNDLQNALDSAALIAPDAEIWVADGVYRPSVESSPGDPRSVTFELVEGVPIYGGFGGGETSLEERAGLTESTILSGDLAGDDQPGFLGNEENAYHVVTAINTTDILLDGFAISGGNANGGEAGAAAYISDSATVVSNCTLSGNAGTTVYLDGSTGIPRPALLKCTVSNNNGVGVYAVNNADIVDSLFTQNSTAIQLSSLGGSLVVSGCVLANNSGHGVSVGNTTGSATIVNTKLIGNQAGGLRVQASATVSCYNCIFSGNGNPASTGGGVYAGVRTTVSLRNCTLSGNEAAEGPGIKLFHGDCSVYNSIVWNSISLTETGCDATLTVADSITQGLAVLCQSHPCYNCITVISADPLFVDADGPDNMFGTLDDDVRLTAASPAIGVGDTSWSFFDPDCAGNPRVVDGLDLGALEFQPTPTIGVSTWDNDGSGVFNTGDNWDMDVPPGVFDDAVFDTGTGASPAYQVFFTADAETWSLMVESQRDVTFSLLDTSYQVTGADADDDPSFVLGHLPGLDARLDVENSVASTSSGLSCGRASIADGPMSMGMLTVTGNLTVFDSLNSLFVGRGGDGLLEFQQGAQGAFVGETISVGTQPGSIGSLILTEDAALSYEGFGINARTDVTIGGSGIGSLEVDSQSGSASLVGTTFIGDVTIAADPFSSGTVSLSGPGAQWESAGLSFEVGGGGDGGLTISGGATLTTNTIIEVMLGRDAGSSASVTVTGPGSSWIEQSAFLFAGGGGTAEVVVADGGLIQGPKVVIGPTGIVRGDATIASDVISVGLINPGLPGPGSLGLPSTGILTIQGDYAQKGVAPGQSEDSGSLAIHVDGSTPGAGHDQLVVTGLAELGGGLFVTVDGALDPQPLDSFEVLSAGSFDQNNPTFDVAFMPGFGDNRYLTVLYGSGAALGTEAATVVVDTLPTLFGFGGPDSVSVTGTPAGVVVGDFDGTNGLDLAIAIADPGGGSVLVLLNDGTGGLSIGSSVETFVGNELTGIAAADLGGSADLDVAVSNRDGDNAFVLIGAGDGSFSSTIEIANVGDQPEDIAVADFGEDGLGDIDLIVAVAGDNAVQIIDNDGGATFSLGDTLNVGLSPRSVDPSDVDNDKDIDAVVANAGSANVSVLVNLGGSFAATPINLAAGIAPLEVVVSDLDGGGFGLKDIVVSNNGEDTISVMLNTTVGVDNPTFAPAVNLPVGNQPASLTTINLEGDPDYDLAVVADNDLGTERVVHVLRNDTTMIGALVLADAGEQGAGENPLLVTSGDLDGDTLDDLITVNEATASLLAGVIPANVNVRPNTTGGVPCPWDCDGSDDGIVGVDDFLAVLAQWTQTGTSCDVDGGGVGVDDFLAILAHWGQCPAGQTARRGPEAAAVQQFIRIRE